MTPQCPICSKPLNPALSERDLTAFQPFCSNRCKLVDLHAWLETGYRIDEPLGADSQDELPVDLR